MVQSKDLATKARSCTTTTANFVVSSCHSWLPSQAHRNAVLLQMLLERAHAGFGVVKDRRRERGVGARRVVKTSTKSSRPPAPPDAITGIETACDTAAVIGAVEADLRAVAIDRRQQDLAGAARLGLARPFDRVAPGGALAAARVDREPVAVRAWRRSRR